MASSERWPENWKPHPWAQNLLGKKAAAADPYTISNELQNYRFLLPEAMLSQKLPISETEAVVLRSFKYSDEDTAWFTYVIPPNQSLSHAVGSNTESNA